MKSVTRYIPFAIFASVLFSHAAYAQSRPKLYPSEKVKAMTTGQLDEAISSCETQAASSVGVGNENGTGKTVRRAAKGAAAGALVGAITKQNVGRSAGAGAALGGTASALNNAKSRREGSPEYRNFVTACLDDKGLKVVGWE